MISIKNGGMKPLEYSHSKDAAQAARTMQSLRDEPLFDKTKLVADHPQLNCFFDPSASRTEKRMAIASSIRHLNKELNNLNADVKKITERKIRLHELREIKEFIESWRNLAPKLEANDCSRLHKLIENIKFQYTTEMKEAFNADPNTFEWAEVNTFVVQHDWAAAFDSASEFTDGEFQLPYEKCAFEFKISGVYLTVLAVNDGAYIKLIPYTNFKNWWVSDSPEKIDEIEIFKFAKKQVRAICIALDAEVANTEVIRISTALNESRKNKGREPLYSYHVVSLSNRRRNISMQSQGEGKRKRLHFRRGHWRHFQSFKTWVRWTLCGDPELGFIDKEYRI
jgi:hypothetical protein